VSHPPARSDITCRNCGTPAALNFCAACGQETALHPPTLGEFLHEFVGHYVALEGALWRTLGLLLRPGRLTHEYLAGRRRRYVLPLRLYLSASFLFFLMLKLLPSAIDQAKVVDAAARPDARAAGVGPGAASAAGSGPGRGVHAPAMEVLRPIDCGAAGEPPCNVLERFANRTGERFSGDPRGVVKRLQASLIGAAPYAVFLLLPVFAGIVALAYRSRRMTYGEHVVFSLHLHAFWFLALLPIALLPSAVSDVLLWGVPVYSVWAMQEVYGGGWGATLLRGALVSVAYGGILLLATLGLVLGLLALA
jgi:hypothetical protein